MARGPRNPFGGFKPPKPPKPPKFTEPPAPRRRDFEDLLCAAIARGVCVELRYQGSDGPDRRFRRYGPAAVYYADASHMAVNVSGEILVNPDEPTKTGPITFEVGKIIDLRLTDLPFQRDPRFNPHAAKYRHGIICKGL